MRPAWYVLQSSHPIAKWVNLLHGPYLVWNLAYVVIGVGIVEHVSWSLLGWTLFAFCLGMGVAAHAYDLLRGDPLKLGLPRWQLHVAAALALAGAVGIGLWQVAIGNVSPWLLIAIPLGALFAAGYGLEWPGLHGDWQFPTWWAVFPLLVAYFAQGIAWTWALLPVVAFAFLTAWAQRVLSTRARLVRRRLVWGTLEFAGGITEPLSREWLIQPEEQVLKLLNLAVITVAVILILT